MEDGFHKRMVLCYTNFMKYILSFSFINIIIVIIENSSIIYNIDVMLDGDNILKDLFTPFYFLSPHLYVDMLNEKFPNQCDQIFDFNGTLIEEEEEEEEENANSSDNTENTDDTDNTDDTIDNTDNNSTISDDLISDLDEFDDLEDENLMMYQRFTKNERYFDITFQGHKLFSLDNSFCLFNKNLIFIAYGVVALLTILMACLFFINTRKDGTIINRILCYILTNVINFFIRPFYIAIVTLLENRPLTYLYRSQYMAKSYIAEETIYMIVSLLVLFYFFIFTYLIHDYINNVFSFEKFPYDCFSTSEEIVFTFI